MFDHLFELLQISKSILEEDIISIKPEAVIIGGGLWFLRDSLRDFEGYRTALKELLHRSMAIFIKVTLDKSRFKPSMRANGSAISIHDEAYCKELLEAGTFSSGIPDR